MNSNMEARVIDPEYVAEPLRRCIAKLEEENRRLKEAMDDLHMHGFEVGANIMVPKVEWDAAFARAALSQEEKP